MRGSILRSSWRGPQRTKTSRHICFTFRSTAATDSGTRFPNMGPRLQPSMRNVSHVKLRGSMTIGGDQPGHAWSESSIKANAPESSGVYAIYSAVWIYIGESNDIQHRLLEHWNGDNACITRADPSGFVFEICDQVERARRQAALVAQFRPLCNQRSEFMPTPSM